jgi:hypothetical protein
LGDEPSCERSFLSSDTVTFGDELYGSGINVRVFEEASVSETYMEQEPAPGRTLTTQPDSPATHHCRRLYRCG